MSNDADGAEGLRLSSMAFNDAVEIPTITLSGLRSGRRADLERVGNEIGRRRGVSASSQWLATGSTRR